MSLSLHLTQSLLSLRHVEMQGLSGHSQQLHHVELLRLVEADVIVEQGNDDTMGVVVKDFNVDTVTSDIS